MVQVFNHTREPNEKPKTWCIAQTGPFQLHQKNSYGFFILIYIYLSLSLICRREDEKEIQKLKR